MELLPSRMSAGLPSLQRRMNRLFEDFFGEPLGGLAPAEGWMPALDVSETEESVLVKAEIPGVDPKEVEISLTGNELTLRGEKREESEEKKGAWHRVERRYGSFVRSVALPASVDPDRVDASAQNGVLTVTIGKREEARPRRISIDVK
jgi:HSP20 family protein